MRQEPTNLNSLEILHRRLKRSKEARTQFVSSQIDKGIAYQIRALRDRQDLSQERLSEIVGMNQNAISRLESPRYGRPTISTLKRLAAAFDVGLIVRFVRFSQLVNWVSGTPFLDSGLCTESMAVPSFYEEEKEKSVAIRIDKPAITVRRTQLIEAETAPPQHVIQIDKCREALAGKKQVQPNLDFGQIAGGVPHEALSGTHG
jgi:transcriptional regulator with XRE-family HTH domain